MSPLVSQGGTYKEATEQYVSQGGAWHAVAGGGGGGSWVVTLTAPSDPNTSAVDLTVTVTDSGGSGLGGIAVELWATEHALVDSANEVLLRGITDYTGVVTFTLADLATSYTGPWESWGVGSFWQPGVYFAKANAGDGDPAHAGASPDLVVEGLAWATAEYLTEAYYRLGYKAAGNSYMASESAVGGAYVGYVGWWLAEPSWYPNVVRHRFAVTDSWLTSGEWAYCVSDLYTSAAPTNLFTWDTPPDTSGHPPDSETLIEQIVELQWSPLDPAVWNRSYGVTSHEGSEGQFTAKSLMQGIPPGLLAIRTRVTHNPLVASIVLEAPDSLLVTTTEPSRNVVIRAVLPFAEREYATETAMKVSDASGLVRFSPSDFPWTMWGAINPPTDQFLAGTYHVKGTQPPASLKVAGPVYGPPVSEHGSLQVSTTTNLLTYLYFNPTYLYAHCGTYVPSSATTIYLYGTTGVRAPLLAAGWTVTGVEQFVVEQMFDAGPCKVFVADGGLAVVGSAYPPETVIWDSATDPNWLVNPATGRLRTVITRPADLYASTLYSAGNRGANPPAGGWGAASTDVEVSLTPGYSWVEPEEGARMTTEVE